MSHALNCLSHLIRFSRELHIKVRYLLEILVCLFIRCMPLYSCEPLIVLLTCTLYVSVVSVVPDNLIIWGIGMTITWCPQSLPYKYIITMVFTMCTCTLFWGIFPSYSFGKFPQFMSTISPSCGNKVGYTIYIKIHHHASQTFFSLWIFPFTLLTPIPPSFSFLDF